MLLLVCILVASLTTVRAQEENDYTVYLDYSLEFPLTSEDFRNWETQGAAIFTKDKLIINPEVKSRQGLAYNKKPLQGDEWMIDVQFQAGNNKESTFGTNGMGIFLLKEVLSKEIDSSNVFGYSNEFIGAAVLLNAGLRKRDTEDKKKRLEGVQGAVSDGTKPLNTWEIPHDNTCYYKWRNSKDDEGNALFNTLRLHYNQDSLAVLYYDFKENQFTHCFKMDAKFSDGVYIAISGASGVWDQDYHFIKTLKTMNPNKIDKTHHAEEAKKIKGKRFIETLKSGDVMHENRLKYEDIDDLIKKVNGEISKFKYHSLVVENLIKRNRDKLPDDQNHLLNLERMNTDLNTIMRDFNTLERMMAYTNSLIIEVEKRPPIRLPQNNNQIESQVSAQRAQLENDIRELSIRAVNLEKLREVHSEKKEVARQVEKSRRDQLSQSRMSNDIPQGAISPELHQIIENSKQEIRSQTESGGSWLKTILTWTALVGIAYFMYSIYKGLKEEHAKL
ncbi:unnamed protein product [Moneuplotes crassus]|uniref:L-type lectin-like domain-containing protein n=2 Tax=Euplotes crassus TaxID=5936 RepID=A0AAD1UI71_EUPCR|nr:unnamed protein product [Moneuplotes crassus]